jgi:hypothetical protein
MQILQLLLNLYPMKSRFILTLIITTSVLFLSCKSNKSRYYTSPTFDSDKRYSSSKVSKIQDKNLKSNTKLQQKNAKYLEELNKKPTPNEIKTKPSTGEIKF